MRFLFALLILVFSTVSTAPAAAQVIFTVQNLSFGQAVVTNNNAQHEIVVAAGGGFSSDPEIAFITNPVSAIYRLTGAAPGQVIDSVVITIDQQMIGAGEDFILDNFTVINPATADGLGEAIINVGARMRTTGNFNTYMPSSSFTGMFTVEVNLL